MCVDPTKESYSEAESCHTLVMATTLLSCRGDDDDHIDDHDHDLNVDESWHDDDEDTYSSPPHMNFAETPFVHVVGPYCCFFSFERHNWLNRVYHSIIVDFWVFLGYIPCILWTEKRLKQMLKCSVPARPPASAITPSPCETWARETLDL